MKKLIEKYNLKNVSKSLKATILVGALAFTSVGCSNNNSNEGKTIENATSTDALLDNIMVDESSEYYNEIIGMKKDIISFCEDSLPHGFIKVDEENKLDVAEMLTNSYIQMNKTEISKRTLAVLDQDLDLVPSEITRDFMEFSTDIARYYQVVTPDTVLPFDQFILDENDCEFITNLSNKIAEFNVSNDVTKLDEIIAIKEDLNKKLMSESDSEIGYNPETIYLAIKMIEYTDAMAKARGMAIITSEEERINLYSSSYNTMCEAYVTSGYIDEFELENNIGIADQSSFESKFLSTSADVMNSILEKIITLRNEFYDVNYSKKNVDKDISEKIVDLYVEPAMTYIEQENAIREETSHAIDQQTIGTTTVTEVKEDQVPDSVKKPTTTVITDNQTGVVIKDLTENEIVEANNMGDSQAVSDYKNNYRNSNPRVSGKNDEWNRIYANSYNATYNGLIKTAESSKKPSTEEIISIPENEQKEDVIDSKETIIPNDSVKPDSNTNKTESTTTESNSNEYIEIIPVDGDEETIEQGEEIIIGSNIESLKQLREMVSAYIDGYYETVDYAENSNSRRI